MLMTLRWPLAVLLVIVGCSSNKSGTHSKDAGSSSGGSDGATGGSRANGSGGSKASSGSGGSSGSSGSGGSRGSSGTGGSGAGGSKGTGGKPGTGGNSASGTGGTGGQNGSAGGGGGFTGDIDLGESVLERGKDHQRTAHFIAPTLTKADVMTKMVMDTNFKATFSGNLAGVPLFVASTIPGQGLFLAATLNNNVYALNETTGATVWMHSLGATSHGVISTPVIDATRRAIYVASDDAANPIKHMIHALSIETGDELSGWPVDVSTLSSNGYNFNSKDQNQRGALSLVGNLLYVPYGGYIGDGGNYRGWVVAVDVTDPTKVAGWATGGQQEGIWAAGGMASDGNGVFAVTGNNGSAPQNHLDSEEIIRIDGMAVPHRDAANLFYPSIWRSGMDMGDKDFGSCSPAIIMATGGTPASLIVAPAKPGHLYLLDAANLGGMAHEVRDVMVAAANAESVYTAPTVYKSPSGLRLAITATLGAKCPGGDKDSQLIGIRLDTSQSPLNAVIEWCATTNGDDTIRRRSPVSTTTDGTQNPIVWFMNGSKLNAFDGETGDLLFDGGADSCGGIRRFTSPIVANGRVIAGGDGHLCSWSIH